MKTANVLSVLLVTAIAFSPLLALGENHKLDEATGEKLDRAAKEVQNGSENPSKTPPKLPIRLIAFADRVKLKTEETFKVHVLVASKEIDSAEVTLFASDHLKKQSQGYSREIEKFPMNDPMTFAFKGKTKGEFNILVYVSGKKKGQETITISQKIDGIKVETDSHWLLSTPFMAILGVIIGGLLAFGTNRLTERLQEREEGGKRKKWLIQNLASQIEEDWVAVLNKKATQFESWRGQLRNEGYYTDLRKLTGDNSTLAQNLIEVAFKLEEYERLREKTLSTAFQGELANQLSQIRDGLRQL